MCIYMYIYIYIYIILHHYVYYYFGTESCSSWPKRHLTASRILLVSGVRVKTRGGIIRADANKYIN